MEMYAIGLWLREFVRMALSSTIKRPLVEVHMYHASTR